MSKEHNPNQGNLFNGFPSSEGVAVTPDERYRDELVTLNELGAFRSREGFKKKAKSEREGRSKTKELTNRYGGSIEGILIGASRNMFNNIEEMRRRFHEAELIEAGFTEEEVEKAFVEMFNDLEDEYAGKENKSKRETRRRRLKKKIEPPKR